MKILFEEKQKFNIILSGIVLMSIAMVFAIPIYIQIVKLETPVREVLSNSLLYLLPLLFICLVMAAICLTRLETTITDKGVFVSFFPFLFKKKTILWEDVKEAFVREYNPITEYGGWGAPFIHIATARGIANNRALNAKGNKGLQLILKDGKRLLIGTQEPDKIGRVLKEL